MADGLLLLLPRGLNEYIRSLRQRHFPVVLIDHPGPVTLGPAVCATHRQGAKDAMRHLIALGHRRIGFITGAMDVGAAIARLDGYRDALAAHSIAFQPDLV